MQSHSDNEHLQPVKGGFFEEMEKVRAYDGPFTRIKDRAERMTKNGENIITAGAPGEEPLFSVRLADLKMEVSQLPDDPDCIRVSLGEAVAIHEAKYLRFRGDSGKVRELLRTALKAMDSIL